MYELARSSPLDRQIYRVCSFVLADCSRDKVYVHDCIGFDGVLDTQVMTSDSNDTGIYNYELGSALVWVRGRHNDGRLFLQYVQRQSFLIPVYVGRGS